MLISFLYAAVLAALCFFYFHLMNGYRHAWDQIPVWKLPEEPFRYSTQVSILIPARNEAGQLPACLESLYLQSYPAHLMEILVIDDFSEDETAAIVKKQSDPRVRLLPLDELFEAGSQNSYKKLGIAAGVERAKGALILTIDADCTAPPDWVALIVSYYQEQNARLIAGPVNFSQNGSWLGQFQALDLIGMMGITGAGFFRKTMLLGNGANLAYEKELFQELNGFEGIDRFASGDDVFFIQKAAQVVPDQVAFLKNRAATVRTEAMPDWKSFWQQRIRWATKSRGYQQTDMTLMLAGVYLLCLFLLPGLVILPFLDGWTWIVWLGAWLAKSWIDYRYLRHMAEFFQQKQLLHPYFPAQFIHILYIVVIGTLGNLVRTYEWKGRRVQ
jgi:cellulose synthase/poly-beta-1,6-N-acetylglucosamine synthase-like glycosyltransferase